MARLLADEQLSQAIVHALRRLGHDVETVRSLSRGKSGTGMADDLVLQAANTQGRSLLTKNVRDFKALHAAGAQHAGIVGCSWSDQLSPKLIAKQIDQLLKDEGWPTGRKWLRLRVSG
jgi:hypothetical protein